MSPENKQLAIIIAESLVVASLAVFVIFSMLGMVDGLMRGVRDARRWKAGARSRYESLRETYNYCVEEVIATDGLPSEDDHWMLQTGLYDLRQARSAC